MKICLIVMLCLVAVSTLLFLIAYKRRLSWWFLNSTPQERIESLELHRFAILIPARNEGKTILPLLDSILKQTYDKELFDVYIVVKEPDDPTIEMIQKHPLKSNVFIDEKQQTKGHALDYALKRIMESHQKEYDGYFIIDADCVLDSMFLCEMNRAFSSGKDVYNSKLVVKNYLNQDKKANSWASYCNGLIWTLMSELGNRAKSDQGIVTMTLGTGLLIKGSLIEEWEGWPFQDTLTEDMELQRTCAIKRYKTEYVSYAICYVEESTSLHATNLRRNRWMTGVVDCDRLFDSEQRRGRKTKQDSLNFYAVHSLYYVYAYIGFLLIILISNFILGIVTSILGHPLAYGFYLISFFSFFLIYIGFFVMTIRCMVVDKKYLPMKRRTKIWIALTHPFYYMGYIGIMIKIFTFRKAKVWKTIQRVEFQESAFKQV
ncbi:MAG: glycosyltransferase [Anaeroplasmataceae bacterium]|nr:glycosyltransferase [Anaeroplasmataceae bacterium]MDE6414351.1 glycosyltransferase [Anaeroplasmataceae bacterium]